MYCHHSTVKSPVPTAKSEEPATDKYWPVSPNWALPVVYAANAGNEKILTAISEVISTERTRFFT